MKQAKVLDIRIDLLTKSELLQEIKMSIDEGLKKEIFTVNNEFVVDAQSSPKFKQILNSSDINIADSTGVIWALKRQGIVGEKLPGADIFLDICELSKKNKYRIYLLGGIDNAGSRAASALKLKFEGLEIAGVTENIAISTTKVDHDLIKKINASKPDIVFVALGAPRQETWIRNNKNLINSKIFMGIGGTLDYVSGVVPRAPDFMRDLGLEWLYRLIMQPSRYKRIYKALVTFPSMVRRETTAGSNS